MEQETREQKLERAKRLMEEKKQQVFNLGPNKAIDVLINYKASKLDSNVITINGDVDFCVSDIKELPKLKEVYGNATFVNSKVKNVPQLTKVYGVVSASYNNIPRLDNLIVCDGVILYDEKQGSPAGFNLKDFRQVEDFLRNTPKLTFSMVKDKESEINKAFYDKVIAKSGLNRM